MQRNRAVLPLFCFALLLHLGCAHAITIGYRPAPPMDARTQIVTLVTGDDARVITVLPLVAGVQDATYHVEARTAFALAADATDLVGSFSWPAATDVRKLFTPLASVLEQLGVPTAPPSILERDTIRFDTQYLLLGTNERALIDRASWLLFQWLPHVVGARTFDSFTLSLVPTTATPIVGITAPHIFTQLRYRTQPPDAIRAALASEQTAGQLFGLLHGLLRRCLQREPYGRFIVDTPNAAPVPSRALCGIMQLPSFQHFPEAVQLFVLHTVLVPPPRDLTLTTTSTTETPTNTFPMDGPQLRRMQIADGFAFLATTLQQQKLQRGLLLIESGDLEVVEKTARDLKITLHVICTPRGCTP
ncbi:hypothetical protein HYV74_03015 [Candidatus Uhrbacteria bacterium]|nr:hypothetical protein [Candidatus Uhrbacteria bacterium]